MARKAPGKGARKAKAAPAPKRKSRGAAAPARKRAAGGHSAYEKRIEKYLREHPGATRQEARGHKAKEHVTRRQKEVDRLEAFAEAQAAKFRGADSEEILEALMARYRAEGIGYLNQLEAELAKLNRRYMRQTARDKRGRRPSLGISLDTLKQRWKLPHETFGYH